MVSDAQKAARDRWDKKNCKVIACKLLKADGDAFSKYAAQKGTTVNALLKDYVFSCIGKSPKKD